MKTRIKNIDKCLRLFEIEISSDIVKNTLNEVYIEIKKRAKIPGFRVGMIPRDILEKYYSKDAEEELLKRLIPEGYRKALYEHKINPATLPEVSDIEFDKNKKLTFKAKVEIHPQIKLKNYKGIKVKAKKIEVSQEEVSQALERLRQVNAQFTPIENKRSIERGDYLICDVEVFCDGKPISKKYENMWLVAEKEASMLGLGEKLIGLDKGAKKEIEAKLPEDYPDKKFTGKVATFNINIKEIKEKKLPNMDDEFAKDLGKENLNTLKEDISKQLFQRKEISKKVDMQNQILDKLLKDYKFDVPPSIAKRQFEVLMKKAKDELLSKGVHKDKVEEGTKQLEPKLKIDAVNKIKIYFILTEISKAENINITEKDIDARLQEIAHLSKQDVNVVKEYYQKNNLIDGLREQAREEKTLDWLLSVANIT